MVGIVGFAIVGYLIYSLVYGFNAEHPMVPPGEKNPNANPESGWRSLHDYFYYVTVLYFSINLFYHLINTHKKILYYFLVSLILLLSFMIYKTFLFYCLPIVLHNRYDTPFPIYRSILSSIVPCLIVSFLFAYFTYVRESLKQRRILEAQKLQLEAQISQANFNFLKAQINPHFLHNTLNFLYAKSLPYSSELSEGILTLSDIMRYALSKGNQRDGKAPLKDEIEHVHNVIKISQLRYSNTLKVNFDVTGEVEGKLIIPFVLITLVENAFMHGELKSQEYPLDIKLEVKGNTIFFVCRNKKRSGPKQPSTGLGLENIKKRLELAYGDKFKFNVRDDAEFYTAELNIYEL